MIHVVLSSLTKCQTGLKSESLRNEVHFAPEAVSALEEHSVRARESAPATGGLLRNELKNEL